MSTREAALAEDPVAYWNGRAGERWTREQARLDLTLRPFGIEALRAAAVKAGERVIDVGCGCGDTTIADARAREGEIGLDTERSVCRSRRDGARPRDARRHLVFSLRRDVLSRAGALL
jgi:cyclopropane fatty-acyl-phospholipid synthase-like methyltransferase